MKNILVISDIHCSSDAPSSPTAVSTVSSKLAEGNTNHPFSGIPDLLSGCQVDAILCPGDITDKGEPDALIYAWDALNKLSNAMEAELGSRLIQIQKQMSAARHNPAI